MSVEQLSIEMGEFKAEMAVFRDEMTAFKDENRREARRMNEQWGTLANKMGTFVEDMVLPSFPHILERYFGISEVDDMLATRRKPHPADRSRRKEFDLIAWTHELVFWNETKSSATISHLQSFVEDDQSLFDYFPELSGKRLIKIASALSMPEEVIDYLTANSCYAMVLGDETMDLVNFAGIDERV